MEPKRTCTTKNAFDFWRNDWVFDLKTTNQYIWSALFGALRRGLCVLCGLNHLKVIRSTLWMAKPLECDWHNLWNAHRQQENLQIIILLFIKLCHRLSHARNQHALVSIHTFYSKVVHIFGNRNRYLWPVLTAHVRHRTCDPTDHFTR